MHHPGPPRFTSVGSPVELAPRNPDPGASYEWRINQQPPESSITLASGPVTHLDPDVPGHYQVGLKTEGQNHELTVRVFPDERRAARFELPVTDLPRPSEEIERISLISPFNERIVGRDRPTKDGASYVLETRLEPGRHPYGFCIDDDFMNQIRGEIEVPGPGRPLVTLDAHRESDEIVVSADAIPARDSELERAELGVEFYPDDRDPLDAGDLTVEGHEARFPAGTLADTGEQVRIHAVANGARHSVGDALALELTGADLAVDYLNAPPEWAQTPTMYEIFVRSFAGDTLSTTFGEIERRVPYLESLGVDCVWLTPVLGSPTTHGYHITDFFETAEDLGTRDEFESLVAACHDADIRVIFDLVVNHTSRDHPAFQMSASGVPAHRDWYVWEEQPDGSERAQRYFNWERIPNLNYDSLEVRSWMLDVVDEWADVVDGFRADVAWGVPHGFWKEVRERVHEEYPDFLLLDETIPRDAKFHELEFDMHYDTTVYERLRKIGTGGESASSLIDAVRESEQVGFHPDSVHLRYVENHDEDRYLNECDEASLRAAAAATFTLPGAPMIYYGQERGMTEYRGPMRWHDGDNDLTEFHRRLAFTRKDTPALTEGRLVELDFDASSDQVLAFERVHDEGSVVVALHFGDGDARVTIPGEVEPTDLLTGESIVTESVRSTSSSDSPGERTSGVQVSVEDVLVLQRRQ